MTTFPLARAPSQPTWAMHSRLSASEWATSTLVSDRRYATHLLMPGKISSVTFRAKCPAVAVWACQVRGGRKWLHEHALSFTIKREGDGEAGET